MSTLYIVATPIGNLEDISLRAKRILEEVDIVACEDTRVGLKLLRALNIDRKRMISHHSNNEKDSALGLIKLLDEDFNIAYISDAGTPGISDPGSFLVQKVREQTNHNIDVIPGPCAFISAISIAGLIGSPITFKGFLAIKSGKRKKELDLLLSSNAAIILYESPYRIEKLLNELDEYDRILVCVKEITKIHQRVIRGKAVDILGELKKEKAIKGEFTLIITSKEIRE